MSRIGRNPISVPKEVKVELKENLVSVQGPKGKLEYSLPGGILVEQDADKLLVKRRRDTKELRALHGLARSLIANMVQGTHIGFKRDLEVVGVGYKVQKKGNTLVLQLGYSHPVEMPVWEGLNIEVPSANKISVEGIDKQKVGEFAARIRKVMPPEPYKGKGIRYLGEQVRKKVGKAMK
jgi:large subunit ribosomal protein L6